MTERTANPFRIIILLALVIGCAACLMSMTFYYFFDDASETKSPAQVISPSTTFTLPPTFKATIAQPSYCYNGPGENYIILSKIVPAETEVDVLGKNSNGADWFMIQDTTIGRCWIRESFLNYNENNIDKILTIVTSFTTMDSPCYSGPGDTYDVKTTIPRGLRIVINGRDSLQPRWFLVTPHDSTEQCWVPVIGFLLTEVDLSYIPTILVSSIPSVTITMTYTNVPYATITATLPPLDLSWNLLSYDCINGVVTGALFDISVIGGSYPKYVFTPEVPIYAVPGEVVTVNVSSTTTDGEPSRMISFMVPNASDSIFKCEKPGNNPGPPTPIPPPTSIPVPPSTKTPIPPPTPIPPSPTLCWPPGHCK